MILRFTDVQYPLYTSINRRRCGEYVWWNFPVWFEGSTVCMDFNKLQLWDPWRSCPMFQILYVRPIIFAPHLIEMNGEQPQIAHGVMSRDIRVEGLPWPPGAALYIWSSERVAHCLHGPHLSNAVEGLRWKNNTSFHTCNPDNLSSLYIVENNFYECFIGHTRWTLRKKISIRI